MVNIMRLRKTKRTVGVNQLFMEAHNEDDGISDADSSSMLAKTSSLSGVFCV